MRTNMPMWQMLKQCAEKITKEGQPIFSRRDLIDCVQDVCPDCSESSLNPIIQGIIDNLRGGVAGASGASILHSVGRGKFVLIDSHGLYVARDEGISHDRSVLIERTEISKVPEIEWFTDEAGLRDYIMVWLYNELGLKGTWRGSGGVSNFKLGSIGSGWHCYSEKSLEYLLPIGKSISHKSDIFLRNASGDKFISVELKYKSAVTDQFKCRAYDALHLKRSYEDNIHTVLLFVKSSSGISLDHAKSISYVFDDFVGVPEADLIIGLRQLSTVINNFLNSNPSASDLD